jgi:hypothetical protein
MQIAEQAERNYARFLAGARFLCGGDGDLPCENADRAADGIRFSSSAQLDR